MEARQEYYRILYGDRFNFVDAVLEEIVTPEGAKNLCSSLAIDKDLELPSPKNINKLQPTPEMIKLATDFNSICQINPTEIAKEFIKSGDRLSVIN